MSVERSEWLQQAQNDLIDITMAANRLMTAGPERHSLDDGLSRFGGTREGPRALPD
jgi:hypothetical protein